MTNESKKIVIRAVFRIVYRDLGVYRWMESNKKVLTQFFGFWFSLGVGLAFCKIPIPLLVWFFTAFTLIVLGAVDHIKIGNKLLTIQRIVRNKYGIDVSQHEIVEICKDLLK